MEEEEEEEDGGGVRGWRVEGEGWRVCLRIW
jgi:hypothetical protein